MLIDRPKFFTASDPLLPERLNEIINNNQVFSLIKHDVSATVGIIRGRDLSLPYDLLVKRFNYRGFFDFLLHILFHNKAKRLWNVSVQLRQKGLPIPEPISYTNLSFSQKESFYLSRVIENAESLSNVYRKNILFSQKGLVQQLAQTIAEWHLSSVIHGDLKWPNILVQEERNNYKFFLIDLDQVRIFQNPSVKGIVKDLSRFYRFGIEMGAEDWVESAFFSEYKAFIPDKIKNEIDFTMIKNKAYKDWIMKGQRRYL